MRHRENGKNHHFENTSPLANHFLVGAKNRWPSFRAEKRNEQARTFSRVANLKTLAGF